MTARCGNGFVPRFRGIAGVNPLVVQSASKLAALAAYVSAGVSGDGTVAEFRAAARV